MNPIIVHARHVAARAAHADAARREVVGRLVGVDAVIPLVILDLEPIGVSRRRSEPLDEAGKGPSAETGAKRRPLVRLVPCRLPDLGVECAFRRLVGAKGREVAAELDVAGADVGDGEVHDGALDDLFRDNRAIRQKRGIIHGVEVGLDAGVGWPAVLEAHFVHDAAEGTAVAAAAAADVEVHGAIGRLAGVEVAIIFQDAVHIEVALAS